MDEGQIRELVGSSGAELVQTHISWVLLKDDLAYKIKKPVRFSFLDFSTLEKRRRLCQEEVRLNRRLSPDIYLGTIPITEKDGKPILGGEGEAIGYAVKMRRLPQESRMDLLLGEGKVSGGDIKGIARMVVEFHKGIDVIHDKAYSSAQVVKGQIDDLGEFRGIIEEACGLGQEVDALLQACDGFIDRNRELFSKRQSEGMVRDCHGDLHSANIFLTDRIRIFDCIEFSEDFRFIDTASEIAFMAMDLDAFGRQDLSKQFVDTYVELSKDEGLQKMLPIYLCYRANVRAKIAAIDYSQHPGEEPKERIRKYVLLAHRYSRSLV